MYNPRVVQCHDVEAGHVGRVVEHDAGGGPHAEERLSREIGSFTHALKLGLTHALSAFSRGSLFSGFCDNL